MTPPPARNTRATDAGLSPAAVSTLASELRLACMRISRRIRFESTHLVAPHQFSVLCRLQEAPRTPGELAEIEKVSAPSMTRTVAALVERGLVERTADPQDRRQVILSLTPEEQAVLQQASAILTRVANE